MTVFFRLLDCEDKAAGLAEAVGQLAESSEAAGSLGPSTETTGSDPDCRSWFLVDPKSFRQVPGAPFAYWVPPRVWGLFTTRALFESSDRVIRKTNDIGDNFRFVRLVPEVPASGSWRPWAKGHAQKFYADLNAVIQWDARKRTYSGFIGTPHRPMERPASVDLFERPGITWPLRASRLSPSALPSGAVFSVRSFILAAPRPELLWLLALTSSRVVDYLCKVLLGRFEYPEFIVTVLQRVPFPLDVPATAKQELAEAARRAWSLSRSLDTRNEVSHAFTLPAVLQRAGATLAERIAGWRERVQAVQAELVGIEDQIDRRCFALYDINAACRSAIAETSADARDAPFDPDNAASDPERETGDDEEQEQVPASPASFASELVSWTIGVAFGRFDVRLATGARPIPFEPDPFDPLPDCSPGMLTGDDGLPLRSAPFGYPVDFPADGVLADDPGHAADVVGRIGRVFAVTWPEGAEGLVERLTGHFDTDADAQSGFRAWFRSTFFADHIKRYSKSRRKAPIYWELATPSGSYAVWLYYHRFTKDTFYKVLHDSVKPKAEHEQRKLDRLRAETGDEPTRSQRAELDAQESFVAQLKTFQKEIERIAPLWNPDLNDGVIINCAPLWRLVKLRSWQTECKDCWDKLVAGDYDWAHLSMHLWPERVVPKCADDRSLAIAHELEEMLWVEDDSRWRKLKEPKREIAEQKARRDMESHRRLCDGLRALAEGQEGTLPAAEVWRQLDAGELDESLAALCLHPRRVLELCLADPDLARRLEVKPPGKRTKAALEKLVKQYETAGYGTLTSTVRAALAECPEPFAALWRRLEEGDLDDQPLALALWPDRVVDRCTEDRELADRHDLTRYFWYREPASDWRRRKSPQQEVADEVDRRHNPTVKAALQSLLDAGRPGGNGGTRRKKRSST